MFALERLRAKTIYEMVSIMFFFVVLFALPLNVLASHKEICHSTNGVRIEHFDFAARASGQQKKILAIGQIHGDEPESGELASLWLQRLNRIKTPSNHWRIIPLLNPDGLKLKTRMNANGVDLNRNFPTEGPSDFALKNWKANQKSDPRRYPGEKLGSEIEVKCLIAHIEEFKPDIIVSIHTPYGLFDFDGPKTTAPSKLLPWRRLGTYPGSLGRWAWDERKIPVLTIELSPRTFPRTRRDFVLFQDKISELIP